MLYCFIYTIKAATLKKSMNKIREGLTCITVNRITVVVNLASARMEKIVVPITGDSVSDMVQKFRKSVFTAMEIKNLL